MEEVEPGDLERTKDLFLLLFSLFPSSPLFASFGVALLRGNFFLLSESFSLFFFLDIEEERDIYER